jgi:hypothetical protein
METDEQKFKRLATRRVNLALTHIHLIGNLSNRSNYAYSSKDVDKIFEALEQAVSAAKIRFATAATTPSPRFILE